MRKRIIIIVIYLFIILIIASLIYFLTRPAENCFDGKQNQNEEGVDCGGICMQKCAITAKQSLLTKETGFIESGIVDKFDAYAYIENPNQELGASSFNYEFVLKDSGGTPIGVKSGTEFILPGEKKYITENNIDSHFFPSTAEFSIKNVEWIELKDYFERPQLKVVNKSYNEINSGIGFSEATGLLKNESPFDFSKIRIKIILKDANGKIVALNATEMSSVKSGENRDFKVSWPSRFTGSIGNMEVQPEVNVFDSSSFSDRFFKPQKFQQYETK